MRITERLKQILLILPVFIITDAVTSFCYAFQIIPLPPPPAGIIPWGNPMIYITVMLGYGIYRIIKTGRSKSD